MSAARCKFCLLTIESAPEFCTARMLIVGERFPHEAEDSGDRMTRDTVRRMKVRSVFGSGKRRR